MAWGHGIPVSCHRLHVHVFCSLSTTNWPSGPMTWYWWPPDQVVVYAQLKVFDFSSFFKILGQWVVWHFAMESLFFCILIINLVLINSFIVIIPLVLASNIMLLKHSHILFKSMSHLNWLLKCDLVQWWGSIFLKYSQAWGDILFNSSIPLLNAGMYEALAQIHNWSLRVFPLNCFLKLLCMCRTQNLCSQSGNTSSNAGIKP